MGAIFHVVMSSFKQIVGAKWPEGPHHVSTQLAQQFEKSQNKFLYTLMEGQIENIHSKLKLNSCADPEFFFRWGQTLTFFIIYFF